MKSFTDLGCTYYDTLSLHAANWAVSNLSLVTYSSKKWNAPVLSKESTLFNFQSFFEGHMSQNRGRKNNYYRSSRQLAAWSQSSGGGLGRLYLQNGDQLQRIHYDSSTPQRYFFDPNDITHCSSNFFAAAKNDCAWQSRSLKSTTTATMVGLPKTIWEDQRAWRPKNLAAERAEGKKIFNKQMGDKNLRTYVIGWLCQNLRAFWEDQTDQKSVVGGPKRILRTGLAGDIFQFRLQSNKVCNFTISLSSGDPQPIYSQ